MPDDDDKTKPRDGSSRRRASERAETAEGEGERPRTAPEVTMSGAEMDRLRDRLRRKFH